MLSPAIEASSASGTGSASRCHHRSHRRELTVTEPPRGSVIHGARSGPVLSHQLRGDHAAQLVEVRASGRLPAAEGLVHREHELLQEPVAGPQFLRQLDRPVPAGSVLKHVVAEVEVHGAQGAPELDGQVPPRRMDEQPSRRDLPGTAELPLAAANGHRSVPMQDHQVGAGGREGFAIRALALHRQILLVPPQAGTGPLGLDPRLQKDAVGVPRP